MKIDNIIFTDSSKSLIKVFYDTGVVEVHTYESTGLDLTEWSERDIEDATVAYSRKETEFYDKMNEYVEAMQNGFILDNNLAVLATKEWDKEELFDLKLKVFELDIVKDCKNRSHKSAIRKSDNLWEIFYFLWKIRTGEE